MATVTQNQNVANSPTNAYPVGIFKQANGTELQAVVAVNSSGSEVSNGSNLPVWNYMSLTQASTTDTYTFKTGGASGTTVGTILITYTDSTKATISTVVRT